jgi:hypothetical protein
MTHLHLTNDSWNLNSPKLYFEFLKFQIPQFLNYEHFSYVDGRLSSFQNFPIEISLLKEPYSSAL